eukprot:gene8992-10654_t
MATAYEKAKAKAASLSQTASDKANAIGGKMKEMTVGNSTYDDDTPEGKEQQSYMTQTIEKIMMEMTKMKGIINECGYKIGGMNVTLGLPPAVSMIVKKEGSTYLSADDLDGIIERERETLSSTQTAVIKSFKMAGKMESTIRKTGMELA